jgi:hypothetical protein
LQVDGQRPSPIGLVNPLAATQTVTLPEEAILLRAAVGHHRCGTPVHVWGLPRSIGPAGLITAEPLG